MPNKDIRDFMFRGLMFESEATQFQNAGIQVGANANTAEQQLLTEALSPFGVSRRNSALEMARLYSLLYCFENQLRDFVRGRLIENDGDNWPNNLPTKIKQFAENRMESSLKDSWLEGEKTDLLGFIEFGHLAQIMIEKWDFFRDIIPTQHWLKQRMDELEKSRNFIAHNRMLLPSEFQRLYMYISDWNRVIGL